MKMIYLKIIKNKIKQKKNKQIIRIKIKTKMIKKKKKARKLENKENNQKEDKIYYLMDFSIMMDLERNSDLT